MNALPREASHKMHRRFAHSTLFSDFKNVLVACDLSVGTKQLLHVKITLIMTLSKIVHVYDYIRTCIILSTLPNLTLPWLVTLVSNVIGN